MFFNLEFYSGVPNDEMPLSVCGGAVHSLDDVNMLVSQAYDLALDQQKIRGHKNVFW